MGSSSIHLWNPLPTSVRSFALSDFYRVSSRRKNHVGLGKIASPHPVFSCSAVQESSSPTTVLESKGGGTKSDENEAPAKPKGVVPAKAPVKPLPELMEEDVIPSLKSILDPLVDLSEIELSFCDNRLEGSFLKNGIPYNFWAFFPDGALTGSKGFSLSSYGSGTSTVEPFLIDEKKITAKHVVFWVEKRLAAQGILPVWKE